MDYGVVDKKGGKILMFNNGQMAEGTWAKDDAKSRTVFKDSKGKEIKLVKGQTWIALLPVGQEVNY